MFFRHRTSMLRCVIFTVLVFLSWSVQQGEGAGSAYHMNRLIKGLFEDQSYDRMVRPSHNYSKALDVKVEVVFNSILKMDLKQQIMRTTGFFRVQWQDDLLKWDPMKYGGMSEIIIPQNKLWHPDVAFYNTVEEKRYPGSDETLVAVSSTGMVYWAPAFNLDTACKFDVTKYPFDSNVCAIRIFSWMNDNTSVKKPVTTSRKLGIGHRLHAGFLAMHFIPLEDSNEIVRELLLGEPPVSFALVIENGEYKVEAVESYKGFMKSERTQVFYDELVFQLRLSRRPGYFILSLLMPVMLLAIMCSTSFLLAPDEQDKLTVAITVLLSFTVFLGVIDQDMPETSDNISLLVVYVSCMLAVGFICVLGNVIVIKCDRWEAGKKRSAPIEGDVIKNRLAVVSGTDSALLQKSPECNNQSDVLVTDHDKMSDQSTISRDGEGGGRSGFLTCRRPSWSNILNKIFFILNLTIVLSLTILMWIMMLN